MQESSETLFYDGRCPLCAREIAVLNRWKRPGLNLVDVHDIDESQFCTLGTTKNKMLTLLHLQNQHGHFLRGLDATVRAWSFTPFGWIFTILRWPIIRPTADRVYDYWAEKRACRLGYDQCNIDAK